MLGFRDSNGPWIKSSGIGTTNLRRLKAVVVKEVEHLTMVLVLDEDHTHYSDTFGNIFESGALSKKRFPEGVGRHQDEEGWGPPERSCVHFCPHACLE